jgi:hypothetical protein
MMGTARVRSAPRISSASSKPSISGICTSTTASATSCTKSSSRASRPERAPRISSASCRSSASRATRFSSRSSTSSTFCLGLGLMAGRTSSACSARRRPPAQAAQGPAQPGGAQGARRGQRRRAASGMAGEEAVRGSWTRARPPAPCTAARPSAPSSLAPLSSAAASRAPGSPRGLEEHVDGRLRVAHRLVHRQRAGRAGLEEQVVVGRADVDPARPQRLLVLRLAHPQGGGVLEDRRQGALAAARLVHQPPPRARRSRRAGRRGSPAAARASPRSLPARPPRRRAPRDRPSLLPRRRALRPSLSLPCSTLLVEAIFSADLVDRAAQRVKRSVSLAPRPRKPGASAPRGRARPRGPAARRRSR